MLTPLDYKNLDSFLTDWKAKGGSIKAIAIVDPHHRIGDGNDLLFRFKTDLAEFKRKTTGHTVLMGRRTADSLGADLLPGRHPVIASFGGLFASSPLNFGGTLWVIGGEQIYSVALEYCDEVHLTTVNREAPYLVIRPKFFPIGGLISNFFLSNRIRSRLDYCQQTKRYYLLEDEVWTRVIDAARC